MVSLIETLMRAKLSLIEEISNITISEDSKLIAMGTVGGSITIYDLSNKKEVLHIPSTDKNSNYLT